jgi:hypothetical protein
MTIIITRILASNRINKKLQNCLKNVKSSNKTNTNNNNNNNNEKKNEKDEEKKNEKEEKIEKEYIDKIREIKCDVNNAGIAYSIGNYKTQYGIPSVFSSPSSSGNNNDDDVDGNEFKFDDAMIEDQNQSEEKTQEQLTHYRDQCKTLRLFIDQVEKKEEDEKKKECLYQMATTLVPVFTNIDHLIFLFVNSEASYRCSCVEFHKMIKLAQKFKCKRITIQGMDLVNSFSDYAKLTDADDEIGTILFDGHIIFDSCTFPDKASMPDVFETLTQQICRIVICREVNYDIMENNGFLKQPLLFLNILKVTLPFVESLRLDIIGYDIKNEGSDSLVLSNSQFRKNLNKQKGNLQDRTKWNFALYLRALFDNCPSPTKIVKFDLRVDKFSGYDHLLNFLIKSPCLNSLTVNVNSVKDDLTVNGADNMIVVAQESTAEEEEIVHKNRVKFLKDVLKERKNTLETLQWGASLEDFPVAKLYKARETEFQTIADEGGEFLKSLTVEGYFKPTDITAFGNIFLNKHVMKKICVLGMFMTGELQTMATYKSLVKNMKNTDSFPPSLCKLTISRGGPLIRINRHNKDYFEVINEHVYEKPQEPLPIEFATSTVNNNNNNNNNSEKEKEEEDCDDDDDDDKHSTNSSASSSSKKRKHIQTTETVKDKMDVVTTRQKNQLFEDHMKYQICQCLIDNNRNRLLRLQILTDTLKNVTELPKSYLPDVNSQLIVEYDFPFFDLGRGIQWSQ